MNRYLSEALGTFILVFCGTGAVIVQQETGQLTQVGVAATFGLVVMVLVYCLGKYSGGHFNPAVSISMAMHGRFDSGRLLPYIGSQVGGALLASLAMRGLFPHNADLGSTIPSGTWMQSFALEFFLAFFLMIVILTTTEGDHSHIIAPLAIGATVGLEAMFAGPVSGASMNPARSIGPAVISGNISFLWIYIAAPILGAMTTGLIIKKRRLI